MNPNLDFCEQCHVVSGFLPLDLNTSGGVGDFVSLVNYEKVTIVYFKTAGNSSDDSKLTLQQKETATSGSAVDLAVIDKMYIKSDANLLSTGSFSVTTQTAATDFTTTTNGDDQAIWIFDIYASDLSDGYTAIQASIDDDLSNTQVGCMLYFLWPARYGEQTLLSAIA